MTTTYKHVGFQQGKINWWFAPQSDITPYELARCLPLLFYFNQKARQMIIDELPKEALRHFTQEPHK